LKIAFGCDHGGFRHKSGLLKALKSMGHAVVDSGSYSEQSVDYPDFARAVGESVRQGKVDRGLLVCGTGIGMAMAANKVPKVRAAVVWSAKTAKLAAEHNRANVLCLPGRLFTTPQLKTMLRAWLSTPYGEGRHKRRVGKIEQIEREECAGVGRKS
jgi:ribose 5-phosphate isomerase B